MCKKAACWLTVLWAMSWAGFAAAGEVESPAGQAAKSYAAVFELKMRILEGERDQSSASPKVVTSSFLKYVNFISFDAEQDLAAEQQIRKVYNLRQVNLLTESNLLWEKGKSEKAFHMFRLDGREYLVMVTPGRLAERNQFRIEVFEQGNQGKTNLLDTEFNIPEKNAAVFGFEDTQGQPYFISLRVLRWSGGPEGLAGGVSGGVSEPLKAAGKVKAPKLIKMIDPVYPEEARKAGIEGIVILEATTDTYGRVANVKILRSIPALDQAAVEALKQWVYEPMIIEGKPQAVTATVTMRFSLDEQKKAKTGGVAGGVVGGVSGGVQGGVQGGVEGGVAGGVEGGVAGGVDPQELEKFEADAVKVKGELKPPKLVRQVNPVYPEKARQGRVEGVVILEAKIDEEGRVIDTKVLRSIPVLDQAAVDAVKQWVYEPMVIDGRPRKAVFTVTVRFMLKGDVDETIEKFAQGAVRAMNEIKPPKMVKYVDPVYPESARQAGVEGVVILSVKTDREGKVQDVMVLRSIPLLDQAAIDAVRQWTYEPMVMDGKPVPVVFTATVRFQLK